MLEAHLSVSLDFVKLAINTNHHSCYTGLVMTSHHSGYTGLAMISHHSCYMGVVMIALDSTFLQFKHWLYCGLSISFLCQWQITID